MRKLMWFTIGFAGACGLCVYVLPFPWIRLALISAGIAGCVLALLDKLFPVLRRIGLVFLGCALGFFWYSGFQTRYLAAPAALDGKTETVTIRTADYGTETEYGFSVEGRLPLEGRSYRVRMYLKETEPLEPGSLITGPFRFAVTAPEEDPVSYLSGDGIFLIARQEKKATIATDTEEIFPDRICMVPTLANGTGTHRCGGGYIPNAWNYGRGGYEDTPRSNPFSMKTASEVLNAWRKLAEKL